MMERILMRMKPAACVPVALAALLAGGCYSSDDEISGGDAHDTPDAPADSVPDAPLPDVLPDVPPDTRPDTPWPDVPPDVYPDTPWPDVPPDLPPDPADVPTEPDAPPGGIVGDGCSSWYDCRGMPTSSPDCWYDIMGFLRFPGGYCTASCYAEWECGPEGDCVDVSFITLCLRTCVDDSVCRVSEGYRCMELPWVGGTYCLPSG